MFDPIVTKNKVHKQFRNYFIPLSTKPLITLETELFQSYKDFKSFLKIVRIKILKVSRPLQNINLLLLLSCRKA